MLAQTLISLAALFVSVVAFFIAKKEARKNAHRELLNPYLPKISKLTYSLIACLSIYHKKIEKRKNDDFSKEWKAKITTVKTELIDLRLLVRYPLSGLTNEFRFFALCGDWGQHLAGNSEVFNEFSAKMNSLRVAIDKAIMDSYISGEIPSKKSINKVRKCRNEINDILEKNAPRKEQRTEIFPQDNEKISLAEMLSREISMYSDEVEQ